MKKILILLIALLLTGCHKESTGEAADPALPAYVESEDEVTQVYEIEEAQNPYEYLVPVTLARDGSFIGLYMIDADDMEAEDTRAFSERAGISLEYRYEGSSLYTAMMDKRDAVKNSLQDKDLEVSETDSVIKLSYQVEKDGAVYPCTVIITGEKAEKGSLITTVGIDNTMGSSETEGVLAEVLDAAGLQALF